MPSTKGTNRSAGQAKMDAKKKVARARRALNKAKKEEELVKGRRFQEGLERRPGRRARAVMDPLPGPGARNRAAAVKLKNADEIELEEKPEIMQSIEFDEVEVKKEMKEDDYSEEEIQRIIAREAERGEVEIKKEEEEDEYDVEALQKNLESKNLELAKLAARLAELEAAGF